MNEVEYQSSRVCEKRLTQRRHASYIFIDDHLQLSKVLLPPAHPGSLHLGNLQQLTSSDDDTSYQVNLAYETTVRLPSWKDVCPSPPQHPGPQRLPRIPSPRARRPSPISHGAFLTGPWLERTGSMKPKTVPHADRRANPATRHKFVRLRMQR